MSDLIVRRAGADDWADLRVVRLAALTDSPMAFGSTLARERDYDEARWRTWPNAGAMFLAWRDGEPVGISGGLRSAGGIELISVWAAPSSRGTGTAATVVGAVLRWARESGETQVRAWVAENSARAMRFYDKIGFTPTGLDRPHAHSPELRDVRLRIRLLEDSGPLSDDLAHR
ncbi:MAG: GNAT family N-acetyltransferase [Actinomycetota bacterium]|nr:GNAT family N-acetyltransferase [Actinomycetota bacterium]